ATVARLARLRPGAPVLDLDVPHRAERGDLVPAQRRPPPTVRRAARRGRPRRGRRRRHRPRGRRPAAHAAPPHRLARTAQPRAAPALPRRTQHPRDGRGAGHLRKQRDHQDQPPQAAHPRPRRIRRQPMTMEQTMELDDLKQAWQSLDRQLQQQKRINLALLTETRMRKAKASLRWLQACSIGQVAVGALVTVFCARFWIAHMHEPALLLSGLVLHAYGVAMVIAGVMEMLLLVRTDYAAQVVTIQRYLNLLRQWRIWTRRWLGLAQWILWVPVSLVMLEYLVGFDLWSHSPATVLGFLAVGATG